jgi:hypothetical protein
MRLARRFLIPAALLLGAAGPLPGQVQSPAPISNTAPTPDFGFNLPTRLGTLSYSLTASEMMITGYGGSGASAATSGSGNLAYLSSSANDPFSMVYSGGFLYDTVPGSRESTTFQNLSLSQVLRGKNLVFVISDSVSYLPEAPTVGLSGIAGVGDIGTTPVQTGLGPDQSIFSYYGTRVSNGLDASLSYNLTGSTTVDGSGAWQVLDFLDGSGYDTNTYEGSAGFTHRVSARTSYGAHGAYSNYQYPGYSSSFASESALFNYSHIWTRAFSSSFSVGPEWSNGSGYLTNGPTSEHAIVAGSAALTYAGKNTGASLSYNRGVTGGSGVILGSTTDTVSLTISHPIARDWSTSGTFGWSRNASLFGVVNQSLVFDSVDAGFQLSRKISRNLSGYGSYTVVHQTSNNFGNVQSAFSGTENTIGVGITYSPAPLYRGR